MPEATQRRMSLLYQLYLAGQASRSLMKLVMAGTGMSGEEYALYSYLFANGSRTLTQGARDLGVPLTTLATLIAVPIDRRDIVRFPHPRDGRARLLSLTDAGRARLQAAIPAFSVGYRAVLAELDEMGAEVEPIYAALAQLREAIDEAVRRVALAPEEAADKPS